VELGIIEKSGAWFSYNGSHIGQGKENARKYLEENMEISDEIEAKIRAKYASGEAEPEKDEFELDDDDDLDIRELNLDD
jgi:recombination protein RecA